MKKILFTLFIIISLTISASAQYKPFQFGLKIEPGFAWTKLGSDNLSNPKNTMSFNWGFIGNFYFVENYGLSTGFNVKYVKGAYSYTNESLQSLTCEIKNQYIEIPLCLTMRTEKLNNLRITGGIGLGFGINLSNNDKHIDTQGNTIEIDNGFNPVRYAFIVKLGVEYSVYKSSCLALSLVYNNNFANLYKNENALKHDVRIDNVGLEIGFIF